MVRKLSFCTCTFYTGKNGQLVFACWQAWTWLSWPAWTWLSWPAWTWLLTGLNMVELASLNIVVDRLEHGWAGQLEHCCCQAWTWLSWPAWTLLLSGLNMVVANLNSVVDSLEHACWAGQLERCCQAKTVPWFIVNLAITRPLAQFRNG